MASPRPADQVLADRDTEFSICTIVTNPEQYHTMVQTFEDKGFTEPLCEFLFLDNSRFNRYDAFAGVNTLLRAAAGRYVILCHQDVRIHDSDIHCLRQRLRELDTLDPRWGVAGNAGCDESGAMHIRITDPFGTDTRTGPYPVRVQSLDENFMVVKADADLCLSSDVGGFHLYGADLCIIADILGYHAYVIDFHLHHVGDNSTVLADEALKDLVASRGRISGKYRRAMRPRTIATTSTRFRLSGHPLLSVLHRLKPLAKRMQRRNDHPAATGALNRHQPNRREEMLQFIPDGAARFLDIGCHDGSFGCAVKDTFENAVVWGVEIDADVAAAAGTRLDRVIGGDVAHCIGELPDGYFDCVTFLDSLEHLVDPAAVLEQLKPKLSAAGVIVSSIPNVRYYGNLYDLLIRKDWRYEDTGTLDRSHLRFYTKKSIGVMFAGHGYEVDVIEGINKTHRRKPRILNLLSGGWFEDTLYMQFACRARLVESAAPASEPRDGVPEP